MGENGISVAIVDDHPAVREGIRSLLAVEPDISLAAAVADARGAIRLVRRTPTDVVVVDYHLPDEHGLSLCLRLKNLAHPPRVLIYSGFADDRLAVAATVAGADALLAKGSDPDELPRTVRGLAAGRAYLPAIPPAALQSAGSLLDPGDLPILGLLRYRTAPADIAQALGTSEEWLRGRRWAMLERLLQRPARRGATSRAAGLTAAPGG
jgi:DNA-binding NarL/FixJ family response regulator